MDDLDGVETDVVVATGTSAVYDGVAHIRKTYAAAGGIESVEDGKLNTGVGNTLAQLLIIGTVVAVDAYTGLGHLSCADRLTFRIGTVTKYADVGAEGVGVTKVEHAVRTGDLECVGFV